MAEKTLQQKNLNDFLDVKTQDIVDIVFLSGLQKEEASISNDIISFNVANASTEEATAFELNFDDIINTVVASLTNAATRPEKKSTFIEPNEIEKIKNSLDEISSNGEMINEFKEELTAFQDKIRKDYVQKVKEYNNEKCHCDQEIDMLETSKQKLIKQRLSQLLWPFDEKTRAFDQKIEALKIKSARLTQKMQAILMMRPAANEKDLLIFKNRLKQHFS